MLYYFIGLIFANLFVYYKKYVLLVFLFVSLYMLGKKINLKLYIICCVSISLFLTFNINYYDDNVTSYDINKILIVSETYENYSIVSDCENNYLIYNNDNEINVGNKIFLKGKLVSISNTYNQFYNYLNKKLVYYELDYREFEMVDSNIKNNQKVINYLLRNKSEKSKSYLKLILFNYKDKENTKFYNIFSLYSLSYLIAVSGFHISILLSFFKKIFKNNCIGLIIVSFYLYLLDFSISSYRAFLCYIFKKVKKKLDFDVSNVEVISLIGSVFIMCNPHVIFSFSFIFSFLSTIVLEIFRLYKSKGFIVTLYIYLVNIPIMLLNYYKLNIASLFFTIILSIPISFLYIFSFLFLFLDKFYLLYELVIDLFYKLFDVLNNFNSILIFGKPSVGFIVIYYLILILFFISKENKNKVKYVYLICLFLLMGYQYYKPVIFGKEQIYFLNVGQGDCIVFFNPHTKEVDMVDTGGSKYKDIAKSEIIPFLESKGINCINKIVLTHDDFDHIGALDSLKSNFCVKKIINTSNFEEINIGDKVFKNLNVNSKRDNDGSVILYGEYASYKLLLMGDASINIEKKIVHEIDGVDIIKIGHHGSNTSSDYEFLKAIKGKIAIISVGKNNSYGHPHKEVLKNLESLGYVIFRSDENDDIGFGKNIFGLGFVDYFD